MSEAPAAERKALALGGVRVFLDPGTLEAFEARAGERPGPAAGLEPEFRAGAHQGAKAIVLSVTRGCNLACSYCYVRRREGGSGPAAMSRETAARALSLLSPPGPWRVGFFGGEPMLQWDLVREVAGAARRRAASASRRTGRSSPPGAPASSRPSASRSSSRSTGPETSTTRSGGVAGAPAPST
jgi:sulfatase maturation enzyme AslB (radical SAM superfamily)